jgi:hypothetical protein
MTTATVLLNIDLAAGTTALVALGMLVVPNTDRINTFRRLIARGTVRRARAPRHATYADAASRASP